VTRALSVAEVEQRRRAPVTHGANSPARIKAKARAHRRRFLRRAGLKAALLDAVAAAYLDGWARALAKVDLFDSDESRAGELREYFAALNAARLWMGKLEARLAAVGLDRGRDNGTAGVERLIAAGRAIRERQDEAVDGG
jgi:hypothetical protein